MEERKSNNSLGLGGSFPAWSISFIAGGIAGTCAKTVIAPLERVKILFQVQSSHYPYEIFLNTLWRIVKLEGFRGLWKGNTATVARVFPYAAIQFFSYERYRKIFSNTQWKELQMFSNTISGGLAGATSVILTYPLDLARVKLAVVVNNQAYRGVLHCITSTLRKEGFIGLYRGMGPTLLGILPYGSVSFGSYELLKTLALKHHSFRSSDNTLSIYVKLVCGGLAGAFGQTVSYPLDIIRRQMQTTGIPDGHKYFHRNSWEALKTIMRVEGLSGFYRGLSINYVRVGPQVAISFVTYESVKNFLSKF